MSSHVLSRAEVLIPTAQYASIKLITELKISIEDGDLDDPKYKEYVKSRQEMVDKRVLTEATEQRDAVLAILEEGK